MSTTTAMMTAGPSIPSSAPSTTTTAASSPALSLSHSGSHSTFNSNMNVNSTTSATGTPNLSTISPNLRAQFVEEINRKKPTEEEVAVWNKHAQDIICTFCSNAGHPRCFPADGAKSVRCRVCNDRRGTCSKVRDEHHFRVKRILKIDDAVFQLLYESTGASSHAVVKRKTGSAGNGGDADSASTSPRLRKRSTINADGVLQLEPSKPPGARKKSKSKSRRRDGDKEGRDGTVSDASSDLSSLCDCDQDQKLSLALEEVKRLKLELTSAKSAAISSQPSASSDLTAILTAAQNELTRTKAAKEEVEKKLGTTTQTLEKVLGQVQPLTQEAVRIKKDNDELRKKLRELEGIKAKYVELVNASKEPKDTNQDPVDKDALAKALERAQKAEAETEKAIAKALEMETKTLELEGELRKATVALGQSEAECTILRDAKASQDERDERERRLEQERVEESEEAAEGMQNQNDKLNAMVLLLKGQLARSTFALKEANGKLVQDAQLLARAPDLELRHQQEVAELRRKCRALSEKLEMQKKRMGEDGAGKQNEAGNADEDVIMDEVDSQLNQVNKDSPTNPSSGNPLTSVEPPTDQSSLQPQPLPQAEPHTQSESLSQSQVQPSADQGDGASSPPSNSTPTSLPTSLSDELSKLKSDNDTLQSTIFDLETSKSKVEADLDALKEEYDNHTVAFKTQTKELITLKADNAELKIKLDRAEEGSTTSSADLQRLKDAENEVNSLQIEVRKMEKERERWERHREKYERDKEKDSEKLKEMKRALAEMELKYERLIREVKESGRDRGKGKEPENARNRGRRLLEDEEDGNSLYSSSSSTQVQAQGQSSRHTAAELQEATREISRLKDDMEYLRNHRDFLSSRLQARDMEHAVSLQKDVVEHTNIHLLNRMVLQAKADFGSRRITRQQIIETCDSLSSQLLQVASRRLEKLESVHGERVNFNGIMDLMDSASAASTSGPRWNVAGAQNLGSLSSASRREPAPEHSASGYRRGDEDRNSNADSQEEDSLEPPLKRRKVPR